MAHGTVMGVAVHVRVAGARRSPATRHRSKEHARRSAVLADDIACGESEAREMRLTPAPRTAGRAARPSYHQLALAARGNHTKLCRMILVARCEEASRRRYTPALIVVSTSRVYTLSVLHLHCIPITLPVTNSLPPRTHPTILYLLLINLYWN